MNHAITMGIFWHLIGAASAACFYAPFKKVRGWSWETMWSVGGTVSWLILPWTISAMLLPDFWGYFSSFNASTLLPVFLFGAMWGIGNINYGLTMRYLGMSMGIGIAIGITLIVGTLMTPILNGNFDVLINTQGGRMTLLGVLASGPLLTLIRVPQEAYEQARTYCMVVLGGIIGTLGYNMNSGIMRGLGDSRTPLIFLFIACVINIVLDLVFVLVFSWGVFGVALATILAQICSWVFGIFYINRKYPFLHIRLFRMRLDRRLLGQVIRLGIPSAIQECQFAVGILIMQALINGFGNDFAAGFTAANKIDTFAFMPIESFSIAATTYVGQNMGAGRLDRVQTGTRRALVLGTLVCLAMSAVVLPLRRPLLMLFNREPGVVAAGEAYLLRALSLMFILAMMFIMNGVLRGAGATTVPMVASIISLWAARIPVAYALAYFFGPEEIYWAYPIGWALGLLICVVSYCRGRWKDKCIVS